MGPCWVLDGIQEAMQEPTPQICKISTAPGRELNSEGVAVLKMTTKWTTNPSKMDTNIDQKSDHILTLIFHRLLIGFGGFGGPSWSPKCIKNGFETHMKGWSKKWSKKSHTGHSKGHATHSKSHASRDDPGLGWSLRIL